jgi:hypothetical protein
MKTNIDTLLREFFIGKTLIKVETSPHIYNKKIVDIEFVLDIPKEIEEISNSYVKNPFAHIEVPKEQGDRDQINQSEDPETQSEDAILIPDNNMETSRPYGVSGVTFLLEDMSTVFVQEVEDIEIE